MLDTEPVVSPFATWNHGNPCSSSRLTRLPDADTAVFVEVVSIS